MLVCKNADENLAIDMEPIENLDQVKISVCKNADENLEIAMEPIDNNQVNTTRIHTETTNKSNRKDREQNIKRIQNAFRMYKTKKQVIEEKNRLLNLNIIDDFNKNNNTNINVKTNRESLFSLNNNNNVDNHDLYDTYLSLQDMETKGEIIFLIQSVIL